MTTVARSLEQYAAPPTTEVAEARALARRAVVYAFCAPYRVYLVGYATDLVGDERRARAIVERAFDAMLAGRFTIPMTDTYRGLRAIVAEVAR